MGSADLEFRAGGQALGEGGHGSTLAMSLAAWQLFQHNQWLTITTPRLAMVLAAATSWALVISSTITTCGSDSTSGAADNVTAAPPQRWELVPRECFQSAGIGWQRVCSHVRVVVLHRLQQRVVLVVAAGDLHMWQPQLSCCWRHIGAARPAGRGVSRWEGQTGMAKTTSAARETACLHASRAADARVRLSAIPGDLIGCVHHHHKLAAEGRAERGCVWRRRELCGSSQQHLAGCIHPAAGWHRLTGRCR